MTTDIEINIRIEFWNIDFYSRATLVNNTSYKQDTLYICIYMCINIYTYIYIYIYTCITKSQFTRDY